MYLWTWFDSYLTADSSAVDCIAIHWQFMHRYEMVIARMQGQLQMLGCHVAGSELFSLEVTIGSIQFCEQKAENP